MTREKEQTATKLSDMGQMSEMNKKFHDECFIISWKTSWELPKKKNKPTNNTQANHHTPQPRAVSGNTNKTITHLLFDI